MPAARGQRQELLKRQIAGELLTLASAAQSAGVSALLEAGRCQMRVSDAPPTSGLSEKPLILLARPEGFEPPTL